MDLQRYVSDELTHLVGSKLMNDREAQYQLLLKILKEQRLRSPASNQLTIDYEKDLCSDQMFSPSVVCFCDIPLGDLQIHAKKYGSFGLSFSKCVLIEKGANPVFYIAVNSKVTVAQAKGIFWHSPSPAIPPPLSTVAEGGDKSTRYEYFNRMGREYWKLFDNLRQLAAIGQLPNWDWDRFRQLDDFLNFYIFSFFKPFDAGLPDDDKKNYYMEREWRVFRSVTFGPQDVRHVIVPETYAPRLKSDLPVYADQVYPVDE
jgi:hypothetical protein